MGERNRHSWPARLVCSPSCLQSYSSTHSQDSQVGDLARGARDALPASAGVCSIPAGKHAGSIIQAAFEPKKELGVRSAFRNDQEQEEEGCEEQASWP